MLFTPCSVSASPHCPATGRTTPPPRPRRTPQGINVTALREVKLLRELRSPHIVRLLDVFPQKRGVALVFEYAEGDLEEVIKDRSLVLSAGDVKAYMQQVLAALAHCHARWVVHRDVKPNNFLVAADGGLRLADFGLARLYASPERPYTNQVFARWYRAPELFFGSTCYGPGVDVWAAGCVFAELLTRRPWFAAESDVEVLTKVFMALGTPADEEWAGLRHMPGFVEFQATPAPPLRSLFPAAGDDALDLLARLAALDPRRRISAADALRHRYFRADPAPTPADQMPRLHRREAAPGRGAAAAAAGEGKRPGAADGDAGGAPKRSRLEEEGGAAPERLALGSAFDDAAG